MLLVIRPHCCVLHSSSLPPSRCSLHIVVLLFVVMSFLCESAHKKRKISDGNTTAGCSVHLSDADKECLMLQFALDAFGAHDPFAEEARASMFCVYFAFLLSGSRRTWTEIC